MQKTISFIFPAPPPSQGNPLIWSSSPPDPQDTPMLQ